MLKNTLMKSFKKNVRFGKGSVKACEKSRRKSFAPKKIYPVKLFRRKRTANCF